MQAAATFRRRLCSPCIDYLSYFGLPPCVPITSLTGRLLLCRISLLMHAALHTTAPRSYAQSTNGRVHPKENSMELVRYVRVYFLM